MVDASDRSGKLYMVSQSRRYHGSAQAYRELIADNLGRLGMLNVDFYIGAHAAVARYKILTRDPRRFRRYFPTVELIAP